MKKAKGKGKEDERSRDQKIVSKSIKISLQDNYSSPVPRKSAHMMKNFFKPITTKDLEPENPEEDPVPSNLDGVAEASQTMEYTSNDEPMDCEGDENQG